MAANVSLKNHWWCCYPGEFTVIWGLPPVLRLTNLILPALQLQATPRVVLKQTLIIFAAYVSLAVCTDLSLSPTG